MDEKPNIKHHRPKSTDGLIILFT